MFKRKSLSLRKYSQNMSNIDNGVFFEAPMTVVVADASEAAEHQPETSVVVASAAAAASEAAAMQGVTLISSDNVEEHQQVVEHQIMVMGRSEHQINSSHLPLAQFAMKNRKSKNLPMS